MSFCDLDEQVLEIGAVRAELENRHARRHEPPDELHLLGVTAVADLSLAEIISGLAEP